jgi:uncharacterized protein (DUF1330 family)
MPYVIARHRVEDYARWKRVFDESEAGMREAGVKSPQIFRNRDDPNELALLIEVDDREQAGRWTRSEESLLFYPKRDAQSAVNHELKRIGGKA